jgi:short-subunit dehydrogenase
MTGRELLTTCSSSGFLSPATVAHAGYAGLMRGSMVVIPGFLNKLLSFVGELHPRRIALAVNRALWQPRS